MAVAETLNLHLSRKRKTDTERETARMAEVQ